MEITIAEFVLVPVPDDKLSQTQRNIGVEAHPFKCVCRKTFLGFRVLRFVLARVWSLLFDVHHIVSSSGQLRNKIILHQAEVVQIQCYIMVCSGVLFQSECDSPKIPRIALLKTVTPSVLSPVLSLFVSVACVRAQDS